MPEFDMSEKKNLARDEFRSAKPSDFYVHNKSLHDQQIIIEHHSDNVSI